MLKPTLLLCTVLIITPVMGSAQALVRVNPSNPQGPHPLPEQARASAIHDVLLAWRSLATALEQNRADLLDPAFTGTARETLSETIRQQAALGLRTRYQDTLHDIEIVFYSPEGLSMELIDNVELDVQLLDHDRVKTTQHLKSRYVIVLTPDEVRWKVRILQAVTQ